LENMARSRSGRTHTEFLISSQSENPNEQDDNIESSLGRCLRTLREKRGFSLRSLAEDSGLSVNTISLIENGKSTPSVTTLQKISASLHVPIVAFFDFQPEDPKVIHTKSGQRGTAPFENGHLEDMGQELSVSAFRPFLVTLDPESNSGIDPIIHTGFEFVYCLSGRIVYVVENKRYLLEPGDSLFFEAHLPHCWQNLSTEPSQKILVLCPLDVRERSVERHFSNG
jgi:transcriptional regulator with XRE-family HTH domain